jgi:hypothetical protein
MITYLELGITDGVSLSLVSPWPWRSAAKQSALHVTFCIVIIRCTEIFDHPVFVQIIKTYSMFNVFTKNRAVCEIIWKRTVEQGSVQMKI